MKLNKFIILLFSLIYFSSCGVSEASIDQSKVFNQLNINEINTNELKEKLNNNFGFFINSIKKLISLDGGLPINVTNSGNVPITISFVNGYLNSINDLDLKIYYINTNGSRGNSITINSNRIINYTTYQEVFIYTSDLETNSTYELVITAKNTKNSYGICLDYDNDGIDGESEDDIIIRFCTGNISYFILDNYPSPRTTINVPNLNPGNIVRLTNITISKNLTDITNGPNVDIQSIKEGIKLYNLTENKYYDLEINYITTNTSLEITFSSNLPLGAYELKIDKRKFKEASPINGYIHRGSYDDSYNYTFTKGFFMIVSTNPLPTLSVVKQDNYIAKISCNSVELDMSTFNKTNIIVYEVSNTIKTRLIDFDIIILNEKELLIKAKSPNYDFNFNNINDTTELIIGIYCNNVKSIYGDVVGYNLFYYK